MCLSRMIPLFPLGEIGETKLFADERQIARGLGGRQKLFRKHGIKERKQLD